LLPLGLSLKGKTAMRSWSRFGFGFGALAVVCLAGGPAAHAGPSICDAVSGNLITNCGFETGDLSGWTVTGNTGFTGVTTSASGANSGNDYAFLGAVGSLDFLSQTFSDTAGASYAISLWYQSDGGLPNELDVEWNGTTLSDMTSIPLTTWQNLILTGIGTGSDTLTISSRNDPGFLGLDDVVVAPGSATVPEPLTLSLFGAGVAGAVALRRRKKASA
jgi:hypothetical protein